MNQSNRKNLAILSLKWNPFQSSIPLEGLYQRKELSAFLWRLESLVIDGGIAQISGDPGFGKSVALRQIDAHLRGLREVNVARMDRPQSGMGDFYREMGELFGVELRMSNRYGGFQALRKKWRQHIDSTLFRPVLLIDEAQAMQTVALSELRLLLADEFDSRRILTVVLAGDNRLVERFKDPELLPIARRIRTKMNAGPMGDDEMSKMLDHALSAAGNLELMTQGVREAMVAHSAGNPNTMMTMGDELLSRALAIQCAQIDEKLFFETYEIPKPSKPTTRGR